MPQDTNVRRGNGIDDYAYERAHLLYIEAENLTYSNASEIYVAVSKAGKQIVFTLFRIADHFSSW